MELKTNERLESTGYRCLLEGVEQYGILMFRFIEDYRHILSKKNTLLQQAVLYGRNDLLSLVKNNRSVIGYLREHEKELTDFNFASEVVWDMIHSLQMDVSNLELYLENIKKLEELAIDKISVGKFPLMDTYECGIYRNSQGEIISITKCYTDAIIQTVGSEYTVSKTRNHSYSKFSCYINNREDAQTFSLDVTNTEDHHQYSEIFIRDFGFDGSKLPTKEDLESYEIPKFLVKK